MARGHAWADRVLVGRCAMLGTLQLMLALSLAESASPRGVRKLAPAINSHPSMSRVAQLAER